METILHSPHRSNLRWSARLIGWHLCGWFLYGLFIYTDNYPRLGHHIELKIVLLIVAMVLPVYYAVCYILYRLAKKGSGRKCVLVLALFYPVTCLYAYVWIFWLFRVLDVRWPIHDLPFDAVLFAMAIGPTYVTIICYALVISALPRLWVYAWDWIRLHRLTNSLKDSGLRFELDQHFQFALLSYFVMSADDDGNERPLRKASTHLAKLKRYSMESSESRLAWVDIAREVEALHALVSLVEVRGQGKEKIVFEIRGRQSGQQVPPLLLLTLADNMLCHGKLDADEPGMMRLLLTPAGIVFQTVNRIDEQKGALRKTGGTGLRGIRERLDLLLPNQYTLYAREEAGRYHAELSLNTP